MVEMSASGDADQVEARLREALDAHGLQPFARINHAAGARKAEVELAANVGPFACCTLDWISVDVGSTPHEAGPKRAVDPLHEGRPAHPLHAPDAHILALGPRF
jgi:hypothetical protein